MEDYEFKIKALRQQNELLKIQVINFEKTEKESLEGKKMMELKL